MCVCVRWGAGKPARGVDVVEDKAELASLLEAEKSRRRLLEQRFSTAEAEADKLRCTCFCAAICTDMAWQDMSTCHHCYLCIFSRCTRKLANTVPGPCCKLCA